MQSLSIIHRDNPITARRPSTQGINIGNAPEKRYFPILAAPIDYQTRGVIAHFLYQLTGFRPHRTHVFRAITHWATSAFIALRYQRTGVLQLNNEWATHLSILGINF